MKPAVDKSFYLAWLKLHPEFPPAIIPTCGSELKERL
jgi:hypothetical protein